MSEPAPARVRARLSAAEQEALRLVRAVLTRERAAIAALVEEEGTISMTGRQLRELAQRIRDGAYDGAGGGLR